jgi:tripartite-type tricarboxylate transporter receptor subunit TctC
MNIPARLIDHAFRLLCVPAIIAAMLAGATAQGISGGPITFIVPFTPGTGPDVMARLVGNELQKRWNQPVIIENKPGASGNIGSHVVARGSRSRCCPPSIWRRR